MVLEKKRQVVRLTSQGGAPWKLTPPLGFRLRILAVLWDSVPANIFDACILTASVGGDNFWQVSQVAYGATQSGCFALGMSNGVPLLVFANPTPTLSSYQTMKGSSGLPDFFWEEQTVLVAVALDYGSITDASLVYELVPI